MTRFYTHLAAGLAKDEALRRAQLEILRGSEDGAGVHPAHWAAFQLFGIPTSTSTPRRLATSP